jgi:hypothetical protein
LTFLTVKHCQHYVETYVNIAREMTSTHQILFYAVSCSVHDAICSQQQVAGFPTLKYFPPEHSDGKVIHHRDSAKRILEEIESSLGKDIVKIKNAEVPVENMKEMETVADSVKIKNSEVHVENIMESVAALVEKRNTLLSSRISMVVDDQSIIYNDAATSFRFALRYSLLSISISNQHMIRQRGFVLRSWLELLSKTLPKNEAMASTLSLTHILLDQFEKVVAGDSDFISNFFVNMGETFHWSPSCTHDSSLAGAGYTCGLWQLFHIMTIGLVERNKSVSIGDRISTIDAAITLRNYIEHFFACEECRRNYLEMYDSCGFDHCHLLTGSITVSNDWEQLSLWLHEVHNDVRVRTLTESLSRQGLSPPSLDEIQSVQWPPRNKCPKCWRDNESVSLSRVSNKLETFMFLRKTLWTSPVIALKSSTPLSHVGSFYSFIPAIFVVIVALRNKKKLLHLKSG